LFGAVLELIKQEGNPAGAPLKLTIPESLEEQQALIEEAKFFELPQKIQDAVKLLLQQRQQTMQGQLAQVQKLKDELEGRLQNEVEEHQSLRNLSLENQLRSDGCYVSVSDVPLAMRLSGDLSTLQFSTERALQRQAPPSKSLMSSSKPTVTGHLKPSGENHASVVILSAMKSYLMAEGSYHGGNSNNSSSNANIPRVRFEIVSMGNNDIVVFLEGSIFGKNEQQTHGDQHSTTSSKLIQRLVCKFLKDK